MIQMAKRHYDRLLSNWARTNGLNGVLWGIAGKCMWDGSGYFYSGNKVAQSPSFYVLRSIPVLGMRAHGIAMLVFAMMLVYSTAKPGLFAYRATYAMGVYASFITLSFFWSWHATGVVVWSGPSSWLLVMHLSFWVAAAKLAEYRALAPTHKDRHAA